jgi:hypothetical protein
VGAQIRRANEIKLRGEIVSLMCDWNNDLLAATNIYLYSPGHNKKIFFNEPKSPFVCFEEGSKYKPKEGEEIAKKLKEKVFSVPFTIGRPTLMEVKR